MFNSIEIKEVKIELGEFLKILRKERKLSQTELAKRLDVSRTTIQNIELGKNFTMDTFLKIMKELDLLRDLYHEIKHKKDNIINTKPLY